MSLPNHIATDTEGYLKDANQWTETLAGQIAELEGIKLTDDHWQVVRYVRQFYEEFNTSPSVRPLVRYLGKVLPPEKGNSLYLQILFPEGPAKQATKIAGLPKPARCT